MILIEVYSGAGQHIADLTTGQIEGYLKVSLISAPLIHLTGVNCSIQPVYKKRLIM